jgi:tubulin polyglutamylase TTLL9
LLAQVENYVCQRYLDNPYLIGGKKFDLRLYCLVTSFSPLVVYLYRSGFCRFSTTRFTMEKDDIQNNMSKCVVLVINSPRPASQWKRTT